MTRRPAVLMYHSISRSTAPDPHYLRVHPDRLDRQLGALRRFGLRGVSLHQLLEERERGTARGLVGLTFDDGFRDFVDEAMPVLARHGMTATVYVVAGALGGTNAWDEDALPLMTAADVRAAAAGGHEVGSHGSNHIRLAGASAEALLHEVAGSRSLLEETLQEPVHGFCFPYGSFDPAAVRAVVDAGYRYSCVTAAYGWPGPFTIPRFFVGDRDTTPRLALKLARHRLRDGVATARRSAVGSS